MKYLFFLTGVIFFVGGVAGAVSGAQEGWDAGISGAPVAVGMALMGCAVGIHIYDNWRSK